MEAYIKYLTQWIRDQVATANAKGVIVGVSGGIDSAVVACLAKRAFPKHHLVVWMPCNSNPLFKRNAELLINQYQLNALTIDLDPLLAVYQSPTAGHVNHEINANATGNLKARLRMVTLYYQAQLRNYLVLGTDNYAEWYTGYFTKYGDGGADLVPLIHLLKRDVTTMARLFKIPSSIINVTPSADLWPGQSDEQEIGVTYHNIDRYLARQTVDDTTITIIEALHAKTEHKRKLAVHPLAFSDLNLNKND